MCIELQAAASVVVSTSLLTSTCDHYDAESEEYNIFWCSLSQMPKMIVAAHVVFATCAKMDVDNSLPCSWWHSLKIASYTFFISGVGKFEISLNQSSIPVNNKSYRGWLSLCLWPTEDRRPSNWVSLRIPGQSLCPLLASFQLDTDGKRRPQNSSMIGRARTPRSVSTSNSSLWEHEERRSSSKKCFFSPINGCTNKDSSESVRIAHNAYLGGIRFCSDIGTGPYMMVGPWLHSSRQNSAFFEGMVDPSPKVPSAPHTKSKARNPLEQIRSPIHGTETTAVQWRS